MNLLEVHNLNIEFGSATRPLPMVSGVSFDVRPREVLALVGESGCGKSISCLALTRLLPSPPARIRADRIIFDGQDLIKLPARQLRKICGGGIGYIFQEPSASLNPVFRIGDQIAEAVTLHRTDITDVKTEVLRLLRLVGIPAPESRINAYPHELSGGMQQRIMIAMALAGAPRLLIADEPTTALDVTIQAQILELIDRMRREHGMSVVLVTHNLGIVSELADRVAVMYAGNIVERGTVREVVDHPAHPYTRALLAAVPRQGDSSVQLTTIPGNVPTPDRFPRGCRFFGRCEWCAKLPTELQRRCAEEPPEETAITESHRCRCHQRPPEKRSI